MKIENPDGKVQQDNGGDADAEKKRLQEASHPFVVGLANAGAMLGRDIGVLALRAIEAQVDVGLRATLLWTADRVPTAIYKELTPQMAENLHSVMLVPNGATVPPFNFMDHKVRSATRMLIDGSKLYVFEKFVGTELSADDSVA